MSVASDWFDETESGAGEKKVSAAEALKAKAKQGAPAKTENQPEPEPVRQQQHHEEPPAVDAEWSPSPEEQAEIAARERAEAGGLLDSADQQSSQPAPTGRRPRGSLNVE